MSAAPSLRGELRVNEPMSRHTSWRAGGVASRYYRPADLPDLTEFLRRLDPDEQVLWLGLGSNLLVRDGGFHGTVIALHGVLDHIEDMDEEGMLRVQSGVHCARLAKVCAQKNLQGGAFFTGIPGTVGGALAMNAGAFGGETWECVRSVEVATRDGEVRRMSADEFRVGYRTVIMPEHGLCFLSADMVFDVNEQAEGRAEIKELLAARKASQPVGQPSCGSVFRNPPANHAAKLIESAGLKGYRIGQAVVSEKHANFILNTDEARADDIEALIWHVQDTVEKRFGIRLEPEVRIVGVPGGRHES